MSNTHVPVYRVSLDTLKRSALIPTVGVIRKYTRLDLLAAKHLTDLARESSTEVLATLDPVESAGLAFELGDLGNTASVRTTYGVS